MVHNSSCKAIQLFSCKLWYASVYAIHSLCKIVTVVTKIQHVGCGAARRYLCCTGTLTFSFLKWLNSLVHSSILDFIYLSCTYLRYTTWRFDIHNAVKLINMSLLIVIIYYCVMSTTKSYSLGVFSVFNAVLLCRVIMPVH